MKFDKIFMGSLFSVLLATSAHGADVVGYEIDNYQAPLFSWSGFYVGGQMGGSWADGNIDGFTTGIYEGFVNDRGVNPSGFLAGLYAGFNWAFSNNLVAGLETDFAWTDLSKTNTQNFAAADPIIDDFTVESAFSQKWEGATRARLGLAMNRWLPFIAGGVAYSKLKSSFNVVSVNDPILGGDGEDTLVGWTAGVGFDYAMTDNMMLRVEYRYSDFNGEDFVDEDFTYTADYKTNEVRVGLAYKFQ